MLKISAVAALGILMVHPIDFAQKSDNDTWGPWKYTWQYPKLWSGIQFRSKCISSAGDDSIWAYQFRSRYDNVIDFVEHEEHGIDGSTTNELNRPEVLTLEKGSLSPVFETSLHGSCIKIRELKIEVTCVIEHDREGEENATCMHDENGSLFEFKKLPEHPRYQ